jgi:phosphoglucosamine mutase
MTSRRYFGTDGIRGRVGEFPIDAAFMLRLGWAAGRVFARQGKSRIIIGKDTRISGYLFESALEAGLASAGVDVLLLGPMPTPAIAYLTQTFNCDAGIVISASHNPFYDNGIKFFGPEGHKLSDQVEAAIEAELDKPMTTVSSEQLGKARRISDAIGRYVEFCKSTAPGLSLRGRHLVLDCAHGATYEIAPKVFTELGATVTVLGASPNGLNINAGVGSTSPEAVTAEVVAQGADMGIAFDGDGDRLVMVEPSGRQLDGDEMLYILAAHLQQQGRLPGGVVSTTMANLGFEMALNRLQIPLLRTEVGDRYVAAAMREQGWVLGGESSGHLIYGHRSSTGDGIVAALQVLSAMQDAQCSATELLVDCVKLPQAMINVPSSQHDQDCREMPQVQAAIAEVESELGDQGRVLLRPSGTEPLVRVMVEGVDEAQVHRLCAQLAERVGQVLVA